jgi:Ni,Fe-hydrogenase III large subunit
MGSGYGKFKTLFNPGFAALSSIPRLDFDEFRGAVVEATEKGARIASLFAAPCGPSGALTLFAVLASDRDGRLLAASAPLPDAFPSLTSDCPQAHVFERELAEQWGVVPQGHPWLKPLRFHKSRRPGRDAWGRSEDAPIAPAAGDFFYKIDGAETHEVAVGPVHAGVIEPGHFRFQCHGEKVFHLEIALGYQHRGVERSLLGGPDARSIHFMETLAGDSSIAHASAYCGLLEALAGVEPSPRADAVRAIALELERIANHVGDLGALAGDVAFLPTMSYCGRIRGDFLNMSAAICGNRFGRNLVRPGGTAFDIPPSLAEALLARLNVITPEAVGAVDLIWRSPSTTERFEGTGKVSEADCLRFGFVGPAARASGLEMDVRFDHPWGAYRFEQIPVSSSKEGDVFARALVRDMEIRRSAAFVKSLLENLPQGGVEAHSGPLNLPADSLAISFVEGWRGEICHAAVTDANGRFAAYKVVDPSFHNWFALALALRDEEISNFPVCNKSFNLSYCGHDL